MYAVRWLLIRNVRKDRVRVDRASRGCSVHSRNGSHLPGFPVPDFVSREEALLDAGVALRIGAEHAGRDVNEPAPGKRCGEYQDNEITHFRTPFVDDKGSIYFLPETCLGNAWEKFPK